MQAFEKLMSTTRIYHLDLLRALLMTLGVVLHSAFVFVSERSWLVASSETSTVFDYLVLTIHGFRMPAFFLLSGFLYAVTLRRSRTRPFMVARARRVLVPLFAAGILLNVPQLVTFEHLPGEWRGLRIRHSVSCGSMGDVLDGCWTIHLWFLVLLAYYFVLFLPIVRLLERLPSMRIPGPDSRYWPVSLAAIVVIGQVAMSISYRGGQELVQAFPFVGNDFFKYVPFFAFGVLLAAARSGLGEWVRMAPLSWLLLAGGWISILYWFDPAADGIVTFYQDGRYKVWLYYAVALQSAAMLIVLMSRFSLKSADEARRLSDLSYTVYLVHHMLVFAVAISIAWWPLPLWFRFLLLVIAVSGASWVIHEFAVRRVSLLRQLFNGRNG